MTTKIDLSNTLYVKISKNANPWEISFKNRLYKGVVLT